MVKKAETPANVGSAQRTRLRIFLVALLGVGMLTLGITFVAGTSLEEQDTFCGSCHTVPETTYLTRAETITGDPASAVTDLATQHYLQAQTNNTSFGCIQCHRGDSSLFDRIQTLALGARDTFIYAVGNADPSIEKTSVDQTALVNRACVGCHETTLLTLNGMNNHFHNLLPQTGELLSQGRQMVNLPAGQRFRTVNIDLTCTSCHLAHKTEDNSDPRLVFVDVPTAQESCNTCHRAVGEG
ncbi:MAG: hypothetical protein U0670_00315 [Anaerolineae bacterium]